MLKTEKPVQDTAFYDNGHGQKFDYRGLPEGTDAPDRVDNILCGDATEDEEPLLVFIDADFDGPDNCFMQKLRQHYETDTAIKNEQNRCVTFMNAPKGTELRFEHPRHGLVTIENFKTGELSRK